MKIKHRLLQKKWLSLHFGSWRTSLLWGAKRDEVITCKRSTRKYKGLLYKTAEKHILLLSFNFALFTDSKVMLVDTYMGQIMRFWYWLHPPPQRDIDEGSGQTLWASLWYFCINRICEQRRLRWACTFAQCHNSLCCSHWKKEGM